MFLRKKQNGRTVPVHLNSEFLNSYSEKVELELGLKWAFIVAPIVKLLNLCPEVYSLSQFYISSAEAFRLSALHARKMLEGETWASATWVRIKPCKGGSPNCRELRPEPQERIRESSCRVERTFIAQIYLARNFSRQLMLCVFSVY